MNVSSKQAIFTLEQLRSMLPDRADTSASPAYLAQVLIEDLYDPASSDEANLRRICSNLEMAGLELIQLSQRLKT